MASTEREWMDEEGILFKEPDSCEVCQGFNGGVRGNELRMGHTTVCDYCHSMITRIAKEVSEIAAEQKRLEHFEDRSYHRWDVRK